MLEIGTAIGYSAFCFAVNNPEVHITTIDMEPTHADIASSIWKERGVDSQITCVVGKSQEVLPTLTEIYDIVFFDGFAPNPDEVADYVRLLTTDGLIISTNLSWNATTKDYIVAINSFGLSTDQHDDTAFSSTSLEVLAQCNQLWNTFL